MKSINEHLDQLGKALDSPAVKAIAEKAKASVADQKPVDTETGELVKVWAHDVMTDRTAASEMKRLGVEKLQAGAKVHYKSQNYGHPAVENYGEIVEANDKGQTARVKHFNLADNDYGVNKESGTVHHVHYSNIIKVVSDFPTASDRAFSYAKAFSRWLNNE
jgi:hypothetical protein